MHAALGWKALTATAAAATVADVALSRHCQAVSAACREANPLMPHNAAAQWTFESGLTGGLAWWSHHRRQQGRWWRLPLVALIAAHGVGAASAGHALARYHHNRTNDQ